MSLSRYEFEVLRHLEKHGPKAYSVREIADEVCLSGSTVVKAREELREKGFTEEGGITRVTEEGLAALEPYRVRKAVILAAGFGSRMMPATKDRPKPMVTVNGTRILDTLLGALTRAGVRDITVVGGYEFENLRPLQEDYPGLKLIENRDYDKTNNISSVMLALDELEGGCYLCEADLYITDPEIITKYQYASNILGSWSLETDDWSFRMKEGCVSEYQKGNTYCYNYYGISYWTAEDARKLQEDFREIWDSQGGKDYFWEFIPFVLKKEHYNVEIRPCRKQAVMEIDNYYELAQLDPSYRQE